MRRVLTFLFLLTAFHSTYAQKLEVGVLGGVRSNGGWTTSLSYHHKIGKVQPGLVVEYNYIDKKYTFLTFTTSEYYAISPGVNLNLPLSIDKGYIYPGVALRYSSGNDGAYLHKGLEYGIHAGIMYKLVSLLYLNVETGFRSNAFNITDASTGSKLGTTKSVLIPITAGLRLSF